MTRRERREERSAHQVAAQEMQLRFGPVRLGFTSLSETEDVTGRGEPVVWTHTNNREALVPLSEM
jgi:hypothetical protein